VNEASTLYSSSDTPDYYPRFGFSTARARALKSPAHAFMALELVPGTLDGVHGTVRYPDAFGL
jgi:putative acetyltransferase